VTLSLFQAVAAAANVILFTARHRFTAPVAWRLTVTNGNGYHEGAIGRWTCLTAQFLTIGG
jgi:hypothetical protein